MVISQHGVSAPFFKGTSEVDGARHTYYGDSVFAVVMSMNDWLNRSSAITQSDSAPKAASQSQEAA